MRARNSFSATALLAIAVSCQAKASPLLDSILSAVAPLAQRAPSLVDFLPSIGASATLAGDGLVTGLLGAVTGAVGIEASYEYIVVGGGTGGNAIAYRLASAGHTVAIVEAGLFSELTKPVLGSTPAGVIIGMGASPLDTLATVDWAFVTTPQKGANNRRVHYARGKCLGGSSALNIMIYHRPTRGALDVWADAVGDDGYRFDNFLPYYEKSVNFTPPDLYQRLANASSPYDPSVFTNPGGPVEVTYSNFVSTWSTWLEKGLQSIGLNRTISFNSGSLFGYHYIQSTIRRSDQTRSSSSQYIFMATSGADQTAQANLKVYTQTTARQVLFDSNKTATGVKVNSLGIDYTLHATKEVIISAGAFQSPQLLMVSGIGPAATLNKFDIPVISELPGVGQNMWDHIFYGPGWRVNFDTLDKVLDDPIALAEAIAQYALNATGPLTSGVADVLGWEKLPSSYRSSWSQETQQALAAFPADWPEVEYISGNGYIGNFRFPVLQQPKDGNQYATLLGAMVAPLSRGNVTLASASTAQLPIVNPNWLTAKADRELAISWFKRMREVLRSSDMQEALIGTEYWPGSSISTDEQILAYIQDSLMTVWHAACTCKMGKMSDPMAVIDSAARVFGVQGLRVVDASSFPVLPPGHPQSTIYALAEKIADSIIRGQ
ncbi:choline dehydrogenase [Xylariales sp. PMI_506]|nr:choline dehydrogenase [Xylariales sp. PMI_506]